MTNGRPTIILGLVLLLTHPVAGEDRSEVLKSAVQTIQYVWKEWMKKGKLEYEPITSATIEHFAGDWRSAYEENGEKRILDLQISPDGSWTSASFRPDMKKGNWYLADGMILLFEDPIDAADPHLATAVIRRGTDFYFLNADSDDALILLTRTTKKGFKIKKQ